MLDRPPQDETTGPPALAVGTAGRHGTRPLGGTGGTGGTGAAGGDASGPRLEPAPQRPRRSRVVVGMLVALVLAACGIGVGIGYAVHGTSTPGGSPTSPATTGGTSTAGSASVSAITARVVPELVNISTTLAFQTARGAGTGMVVGSSGRVVTNNHVIAGATAVSATDLANGRTYDASVVGYDVADDVAVLQLQGASGLPTVRFAGSSPRLGDSVVAIGNAGGAGTPTAAAGMVTGLNQSITALSELSGTTEHLSGLIETDAAIQPGQSGGPLVNRKGRVLGMVTAGSTEFSFSQGASQGYAVPAPTFRSITAAIVSGTPSATVHVGPTAFLGVKLTSVQGAGAFVVEVVSTSPAAAAGIAPGDLIVGLAGQTVSSPDTVSSVLAAYDPGATLQVQLVGQAGQQRTVTVTLAAGPPA